MEGNDMNRQEQFLTEVFPEELIEIKKRQENLSVVPNEHIDKVIDVYKKYTDACRELENAKKGHGLGQRISKITQKYLKINLLKKFGLFQAIQSSKENLDQIEKKKQDAENDLKTNAKPSTKLGIVGLALSGGGIRSATFSLGVLQVLAKFGILKHVDYLSTVSGGGYIGSCLSSVLNSRYTGTEGDKFPLRHKLEENETAAVRQLRNNSNYLAPNGLLDYIRIPAILLRGAVINILILLPYVVLAAVLTEIAYSYKELQFSKHFHIIILCVSVIFLALAGTYPCIWRRIFKDKYYWDRWGGYGVPVIFLYIGSLLGMAFLCYYFNCKNNCFVWNLYEVVLWSTLVTFLLLTLTFPYFWSASGHRDEWTWRSGYEAMFRFSLFLIPLMALVKLVPTILSYYCSGADHDYTILKAVASAIISFVPVIFAGKAAEKVSQWGGKLALSVIGIIGPLILFVIYLQLCVWVIPSIFSPPSGSWIEWINWKWYAYVAIGLFFYTRILVDVNAISLHNFYRDRLSKAYLFRLYTSFEVTEVSLASLKKLKIPGDVLEKLESIKNIEYTREDFLNILKEKIGDKITDNLKSLILEHTEKNSVMSNDRQKLSELNAEGTKSPYHLINVALNIQGSEYHNRCHRNAEFFILSKRFCGSRFTSYCKTKEIEKKIDPHLNLGTAMAISGAAVAPNMGTVTIKPLTFIMALLNVRLGYWLPNPYWLKERGYKWWRDHRYSPFSGVGPVYLFKELFGRVEEGSQYVNVSDGGHIENLAIYQLLQRRCKYIIVCDAEADSDLTFRGLATLIRYARIDMGIEIEIELDEIRNREDGLSRKHCVLGKIHYRGGETGYLLYIKSSVTGDESEDIREYRSRNSEFPHESTSDQFFDEAQFEAYRVLGYHIVDELEERQEMKSNEAQLKKAGIVEEWFKKLDSSLQPRFPMEEKFVHMQEQLSAIEKQFRDPDVAEYTYQIYPELLSKQVVLTEPSTTNMEKDERFLKIFHLCNLQMQLMENVFIALQLDKPGNRDHHFNRGWMNLFCRWAKASFFRRAWAVSIGTYGIGLQIFCEEFLRLHSTIQWQLIEKGEEKTLTDRERYYLDQQEQKGRFKSHQVTVADNKEWLNQIWIAKMSVELTPEADGFGSETKDETNLKETFPIGFALINLSQYGQALAGWEDYQAKLVFYRIRDYYRKMQLLKKMISELPNALKHKLSGSPKFQVNFEKDKDRIRYGYFFERYGFEAVSEQEKTPLRSYSGNH